MVLVQTWLFFRLFFLGNIGQQNILYDIPEGKNSCPGYTKEKFIKSKNCYCVKGVNPWFWTKNGRFSNFFFFGNKGLKNIVYHILERKNAFLGYKSEKFKKSKNGHFSKGVNSRFWSKNGHFSNFF